MYALELSSSSGILVRVVPQGHSTVRLVDAVNTGLSVCQAKLDPGLILCHGAIRLLTRLNIVLLSRPQVNDSTQQIERLYYGPICEDLGVG